MDKMNLYLVIALAPLVGSLLAGLLGKVIAKGAHIVTISQKWLLCCLVASCTTSGLAKDKSLTKTSTHGSPWVVWILGIGFMVDSLTALMLVVVTSVSLMVHIYTIGYMSDD